MMDTPYVELHCHSAYSLLDGTSTPQALVARAAALDMPALALTDHNALYGAIPFVEAARQAGIQPILGAELTLHTGDHLTLLVENTSGWRSLCRLISAAQAQAPKGQAALPVDQVLAHTDGLICLSGCRKGPIAAALLRWDRQAAFRMARTLREAFGPDRFWIELQHHHQPDDAMRVENLVSLARHLELPYVVTNNVHYARRSEQRLHDTLSAIRQRLTLDAAEPLLRSNDEYYLKRGAQLRPLFPGCRDGLPATLQIAERCTATLPFGLQDLPIFPTPDGLDAPGYLRRLCRQALPTKYGDPPERICRQLAYELELLERAGLANYVLMVWDVVRFAREQGIRCQGRGSAANALVAYLLGISPIDPLRHQLVFERFLSPERPVLPDIDLDVAADRREEVIQYLTTRYGSDHVALACTFLTFQARSALRDVAKALDLSPALVVQAEERLARQHATDPPADAALQLVLDLCQAVHGLPRHLGQHSGGMVITGPPIATRVPVEPTAMPGRRVTQWDKDALETAGLVKFDVLGLRMLAAITEAIEHIQAMTGQAVDLDRLSYDDPAIYAMLTAADTIGVFQVESRAQARVLPRLRPTCFADLTIAISLIRPGPIQGHMVHPYLRRRAGTEPVTFAHPALEPVLRDTLGVLLFQEQVLLVAEVLAGWSRGQGEVLRRALAQHDDTAVAALEQRFLADAAARAVTRACAAEVFGQIRAFAGYSFPRSHAAAFAVLVYQSAWLKQYHPVAFLTSLLNQQPMGFWSPSVLVNDARRHGVRCLTVDIHRSARRCTIEPDGVRIGLTAVRGLGERGMERIIAARRDRPFADLAAFCRRTRLPRPLVERLILAGAMDLWGMPRRTLLWELGTLRYAAESLELSEPLPPVDLPPLTYTEMIEHEEAILGLSVRGHLLASFRRWLTTHGVCSSRALRTTPSGERVMVVGKLVVHQAPPTAKGHHFLTLEDEDGVIDSILRPTIASRYAALLRTESLLWITGMLQHEDGVTHVLAWQIESFADRYAGGGVAARPC